MSSREIMDAKTALNQENHMDLEILQLDTLQINLYQDQMQALKSMAQRQMMNVDLK